jgi:hypothetical protein
MGLQCGMSRSRTDEWNSHPIRNRQPTANRGQNQTPNHCSTPHLLPRTLCKSDACPQARSILQIRRLPPPPPRGSPRVISPVISGQRFPQYQDSPCAATFDVDQRALRRCVHARLNPCADVTTVGLVYEAPDDPTSKVAKRIINPNVAIELGYALRALTDRALLKPRLRLPISFHEHSDHKPDFS